MDPVETMALGVVVERREIDNPWQSHVWQPVAVIPGAPKVEGWQLLARGAGWIRYHAATLMLELHHKEAAAYRANLSNEQPVIYVGMHEVVDSGESGFEVEPFLVTASPYEAQDYLDSSEVVVEGVPMSEGMMAWVQAFVDEYYVEERFEKRKRKRLDPDAVAFGSRPGNPSGPPAGRGNGHG